MDWSVKGGELRKATIAAMDEVLDSLDGERLYAICLQTDDGGMSVGLCANTEEGYSEKRVEAEEAGDLDESFDAYLRWNSAEWRHEMTGWEHFRQIEQDLSEEVEDPEGGFETYFEHLIDAMIDALATLRSEREQALQGVTLFVTITDSEETIEVEDRSAVRLNPAELSEPFLRRYDEAG